MKHFLTALMLVSWLGVSCNLKPHLELSDHSPYTLKITDFQWSYGTIEVNKFNGDFETLDHKVFDVLVNKQGSCTVIMENETVDNYGKRQTATEDIGVINLSELNKYESWEYWHKDGGIQKLLNHHLFTPTQMADSAHENVSVTTVDTAYHAQNLPMAKSIDTATSEHTFSFSSEDLYESNDERAHIDSLSHIDSGLYRVDGVITNVYLSKGTIIVHETTDLKLDHIIHVFPYSAASVEVTGRLILALRKGAKIHSICTQSQGITEQLISADITFK